MANNIKLDNTFKELEKFEIELIKEMQNILKRDNRNASYKLYNSFEGNVEYKDSNLSFTIEYAPHGNFVLNSKRNI